MYRLLSRYLLITSLIALLSACGSSRKNLPSSGGIYPPGAERTATGLTWTDLRVPVNVNITSPASLKVGGMMTMVNGKDIHMSLRMFGFEVGAAYITADSVWAYAKLQRVYIAESTASLLNGVTLPVADIQALLIGAPVTLPESRRVKATTSELTGQPLGISIDRGSGRNVSVIYEPVPGAPLASDVEITAGSDKKRIEATLSYDWSRAKTDTGASVNFSIPAGYRRINAAALLKAINNR